MVDAHVRRLGDADKDETGGEMGGETRWVGQRVAGQRQIAAGKTTKMSPQLTLYGKTLFGRTIIRLNNCSAK